MLRGKISKIVEYSSKKKKKKIVKMFDLIFSHLLLVFKIKYLNSFFFLIDTCLYIIMYNNQKISIERITLKRYY